MTPATSSPSSVLSPSEISHLSQRENKPPVYDRPTVWEEHPSAHNRLKRVVDVVGASFGLGFFILILPALAIAIRIDSEGPIFYSQKRCGLKGKTFSIWKLRTMVPNAEKLKDKIENQANGLIFKNENDPRITNVGRFLRKTSLDEFPQFLNVLQGSMSLVGTRPPTLDEVARYRPHHWRRLQVKPGITGEWQAKGRSTVGDFEAIVAMDMRYQARWSVGYDLRLIWLTVWAVLQRKGAC